MFLEKPRAPKVQKKMTARVVTKEDVEHVLAVIKEAMLGGSLDEAHGQQFIGIMLFGAFGGQRPYSTITQLRVEQFNEASQLAKPTVHIEPMQDKIRMEHFVPLHSQIGAAMNVLCEGREGKERMFILESFRKWTQKLKIP